MQGVIVLGVGLLALLLFGSKAKAAQAANGGQEPGGSDPWQVVNIKTVNGEAFFDLFAVAGAFGPHDRMFVLRYKEVLFQGQPRRVLIAESGAVPEEIRARARDDFGLIQAPVQTV